MAPPDADSPADDPDGVEMTAPRREVPAVGAIAPPAGPSSPDGATAGSSRPASGRRHRWLIETVVIVIVAVLVAVLLRAFVVQTYYIPSGSMLPTLQIGDRIVVDKLSYHLHGVGRGDIVVFARPPQENCGGAPVNDLVKRVIALPGETISAKDGQVYVDGKKLAEPWLPFGTPTNSPDNGRSYDLSKPYKVPAGEYYVMGDNRTESCDSRYWGPVAKSLLVGKVVMRVWPLSGLHFF